MRKIKTNRNNTVWREHKQDWNPSSNEDQEEPNLMQHEKHSNFNEKKKNTHQKLKSWSLKKESEHTEFRIHETTRMQLEILNRNHAGVEWSKLKNWVQCLKRRRTIFRDWARSRVFVRAPNWSFEREKKVFFPPISSAARVLQNGLDSASAVWKFPRRCQGPGW